ncbi:hypothetical protein FSP39_024969 [Pinctada imbricata]|uniref:Galactose mutarotase n=1 Tax=Pinctada imbricata TaxID=66713 RepID=A0AA88XXB6_PINIB|nr:hypothetical protein FSP39_024969 [Pinctada imbricata]
MEEGFPGELTVKVTYQLTDDNELKIDYSATTTKKTIINLTNHAYFNLGGHVSIKQQQQQQPRQPLSIAPILLQPRWSCVIQLVDGKAYDLREKKTLGDVIPSAPGGLGFDINYSFDKTGWRKYMARVEHPPSGRVLELYSTEPGLQFYTGYHLDYNNAKDGAKYEGYGGFSLEAQHYPDSPNKLNLYLFQFLIAIRNLLYLGLLIIALLCVVIYLGVKASRCPDDTTPPSSKMIEKAPYGQHDGQEIYKYTLKNKNNIEVSIINYGGIITNILVPDRQGKQADINLGFDDMNGYSVNGPYLGALIGRYANRVAGGQFSIDGQTYNLPINNGPNALHGGIKGFDKRVWQSSIEGGDILVLRYVSADGEEGYPGEVTVKVTYQLTDDNELKIEYTATTTKKTIINLTNHAYFNLGGHDSGTVFDHFVTLYADHYTPIDADSIPLGRIDPVSGTRFDLRNRQNLGQEIPQVPGDVGFDHNFCFGKTGWRKYMARVDHPPSGRFLEMYSTEPGVQFYTAHYLNETGKGGAKYGQYGAFCLEAQHYPDSPNKPNFPTTLLAPGEVYLQSTMYKFGSE